MANYILTGGAGFIGSNLAQRLIQDGHRVYILDDLSTGFERNIPKNAIFHKVDISRWHELEGLNFEQPVVACYHLAAQSSGEISFENPAHDIDANYKASYNMLQLCQKIGCSRFIFASSMSVYGQTPHQIVRETDACQPVSYYGLNKLASEHLIRIFCQRTNIKPTCFRLFNVYGQGQNMNNMKQGMVSIYLSYWLHGQKIHVKGSLDRFRDFIFVQDVVEALVRAEHHSKSFFENINLGTGKKTEVKALLEAILADTDKNIDNFVRVEGYTDGDVKGCIADTQKLENILDWKAQTSLQDGIAHMKKWLENTKNWWIQ